MKNLLLISALIAASTSGAFAMNNSSDLSAATKFEARQLVPGANFDNLTQAQALAIADAVHSDQMGAAALIRSILANG
jgi:hypothetical protein